jgi:hypothetical protein
MKQFNIPFLLIFLTLFVGVLEAQNQQPTPEYEIRKTSQSIKIDGDISEDIWNETNVVENLINHWPLDSGFAKAVTEIRMTFDDKYLYVAAKMFDNGKRVIQTLKRDPSDYWLNDSFTLLLDPLNNQTSGYVFGVTAWGSQMEGTLSILGTFVDMNTNWDNKWFSSVKRYDNYWTAEMAIPLNTIRYQSEKKEWGLSFIRSDRENNIYAIWKQFPANFQGIDPRYAGKLKWMDDVPKFHQNLFLLPYTTGGITRNHEDNEATQYIGNVGFDAKLPIGSTMSLDMTVKPDFSNADVDQQVTNVTRLNILFPERRAFFLENSDIFSNYGTDNVKPFFSRSIGLHNSEAVPINYGLRLSGNLFPSVRMGLMNIQTQATEDTNPENFSVLSIQKNVWGASRIKTILIHKQSTQQGKVGELKEDFNSNVGMEFDYISKNNKWNGGVKYHHSFSNQTLGQSNFGSVALFYQSRNWGIGGMYEHTSQDYLAEVGYTQKQSIYDPVGDSTTRKGYDFRSFSANYSFRPKDKILILHGPRLKGDVSHFQDGSFSDSYANLSYEFNFKDASVLSVGSAIKQENLIYDVKLSSKYKYVKAGEYQYLNHEISYSTNNRKALSGTFKMKYGDLYDGTVLGYSANLSFRKQPWGNFGINYSSNQITLPTDEGNQSMNFELISPRADISFSTKINWSSILQYNTQNGNMNVYSRIQYRFKPMSDIFLIYTDNYGIDNFQVKNRGIILKMTYWFGI